MAKVLVISRDEPADVVEEKVKAWSKTLAPVVKPFNAAKYTGKIKTYGDALAYQRKLRDEWD